MNRCSPSVVAAFASMSLLFSSTAFSGSQVVVDQSTGKTFAGVFNADAPSITWQQEVLVGVTGKLIGIDILPQSETSNPPTESTFFFVNVGSPWQFDANDFEAIITVPTVGEADWFYVDVSSANIVLEAGDTFVWGTKGINGGLWLHGQQLQYPGQLWIDAPPFGIREQEIFGSHSDLAFRSHMMIVPEPTSSLLCAISLAGGVAYCVSRKSRQE